MADLNQIDNTIIYPWKPTTLNTNNTTTTKDSLFEIINKIHQKLISGYDQLRLHTENPNPICKHNWYCVNVKNQIIKKIESIDNSEHTNICFECGSYYFNVFATNKVYIQLSQNTLNSFKNSYNNNKHKMEKEYHKKTTIEQFKDSQVLLTDEEATSLSCKSCQHKFIPTTMVYRDATNHMLCVYCNTYLQEPIHGGSRKNKYYKYDESIRKELMAQLCL
jgi:hypothetical protein